MAEVREALVIHPGDHLLVRVDRDTTPEEAVELRRQMLDAAPALANVTVLAADGLAVLRADALTIDEVRKIEHGDG